jgi:hypothetical protein
VALAGRRTCAGWAGSDVTGGEGTGAAGAGREQADVLPLLTLLVTALTPYSPTEVKGTPLPEARAGLKVDMR